MKIPAGLNRSGAAPGVVAAAGRASAGCLVDFAKLEGLGNDFVLVSDTDLEAAYASSGRTGNWQDDIAVIARRLCHRHFGVGADGLIVARKSDRDDCEIGWRYINSDGSPSDMCGNGLRCLALWAIDREVCPPRDFNVATARGPVRVHFASRDAITIDLGEPDFASVSIPVAGPPRQRVVREEIKTRGLTFHATCLNMGNPHCVIINPDLDPSDYLTVAPEVQALDFFPEGVNVEFVLTEKPDYARVVVWERGCGPTLACASGAAAVLVAGVVEGILAREAAVELPGGRLQVSWSQADNRVRLTGPAREVFRGSFDLTRLLSEE